MLRAVGAEAGADVAEVLLPDHVGERADERWGTGAGAQVCVEGVADVVEILLHDRVSWRAILPRAHANVAFLEGSVRRGSEAKPEGLGFSNRGDGRLQETTDPAVRQTCWRSSACTAAAVAARWENTTVVFPVEVGGERI